jgi:hypothetical protein
MNIKAATLPMAQMDNLANVGKNIANPDRRVGTGVSKRKKMKLGFQLRRGQETKDKKHCRLEKRGWFWRQKKSDGPEAPGHRIERGKMKRRLAKAQPRYKFVFAYVKPP